MLSGSDSGYESALFFHIISHVFGVKDDGGIKICKCENHKEIDSSIESGVVSEEVSC